MKKHLSSIILVIVFFVGLAVLLYPTISNIYSITLHQDAVSSYESYLTTFTEDDCSDIWDKVDAYNALIGKRHRLAFVNGEAQGERYKSLLNVRGTMMGYIEIPSIDVMLPIYHGTSEATLSTGIGHLEGSSLPGGGVNTNTILSGHRGLPSAKLFTDLDQLGEGDIFYLHVLNRTLTYMVEAIEIVKPDDVDTLRIYEGKDCCTLVTCTPYGINTHRLIIRGVRIDADEQAKTETTLHIYKEAEVYSTALVAPIASVPLFIIMLIYLLIRYRKKRK